MRAKKLIDACRRGEVENATPLFHLVAKLAGGAMAFATNRIRVKQVEETLGLAEGELTGFLDAELRIADDRMQFRQGAKVVMSPETEDMHRRLQGKPGAAGYGRLWEDGDQTSKS